jgi:hypothetical protein
MPWTGTSPDGTLWHTSGPRRTTLPGNRLYAVGRGRARLRARQAVPVVFTDPQQPGRSIRCRLVVECCGRGEAVAVSDGPPEVVG